LATEVAQQLTTDNIDDVVKIHARDELGINVNSLANPLQAAVVSAFTFFSGGIVPFLCKNLFIIIIFLHIIYIHIIII